MSAQELHETITGCRTRIMRKGSGTPLLFLHGASGATQWLPFMDRLAERHEVWVPEHPGFGGTDTPAWLDNMGDLAFFYLDFMRQFGLGGVNLVGASLGGWLACEVAVRSTAALRSLTLVAPAGLRVPGLRKTDIFMLSPEDTVRHLFHDPALTEAALAVPQTEATLETSLKNRLAVAKLAWEPRLYSPHLHKWLHRVDVPALVLWGRQDRIIPEGYAARFAELIPGARRHVIENCGHLPHVEKADEFVSAVESFIEGRDDGRIAA